MLWSESSFTNKMFSHFYDRAFDHFQGDLGLYLKKEVISAGMGAVMHPLFCSTSHGFG